MTFFKKHTVLVVGGGIALVLALIVVFLLIRSSREYARIQDDLQRNLRVLEQLHRRAPFPSNENVARLEANLEQLQNYRGSLLSALSAHQAEAAEIERVAFPPHRERTMRRIRELAARNNVRIPEAAEFGFGQYAAGNLPRQEHVPRLMSQLQMVERISVLLINAGIHELTSVDREVFDVERTQRELADTGTRRGVTERVVEPEIRIEPDGVEGLYTRERYTLSFMASDEALREALNRMVASPVLMVVRSLELRNEMGLGGTSASARLAARLAPRESERPGADRPRAEEIAQPRFHEDRVVAGRERVRVRMEVDVYHFKHAAAEEDQES